MDTLNIIFSLNVYGRYVFKKTLEKKYGFKWNKNSAGTNYFFDSEGRYILNLSSSSLKVTFLEGVPIQESREFERSMKNIIKKKFNENNFFIEKLENGNFEILEV